MIRFAVILALATSPISAAPRKPAPVTVGDLPKGPLNAITDVPGVSVGHVTIIEGEDIRTGVTAILPHAGNVFQDKVPAGFFRANGFGKLAGSNQVEELGEIETPIVLTNTLNVAEGIAGTVEWTIAQPGNENVRSVNAVVGETNDGYLNAIRKRRVTKADVRRAIESARFGPVAEGNVGAGTGTRAFRFKGGIGTASRRINVGDQTYTLGALVQTNFDGTPTISGRRLDFAEKDRKVSALYADFRNNVGGGSIIMIIATDAPLSDRNLARLARRAIAGLARTGANFENGSGDFALAFSTAATVRRTPSRRGEPASLVELPNDLISPLFLAAADATEDAIYRAMFAAVGMRGDQGHELKAIPPELIADRLQSKGTR